MWIEYFPSFFSPTVSSKDGSGSANFLIVVICTKVGNEEEEEEEPLFCHFSLSPLLLHLRELLRDSRFPTFSPISSVTRMHFPTFFFFSAQKKNRESWENGACHRSHRTLFFRGVTGVFEWFSLFLTLCLIPGRFKNPDK